MRPHLDRALRYGPILQGAILAASFAAGSPLAAQGSLAARAAPGTAMVLVEGGTFAMGIKDGDSYVAEEFVHEVDLDSFYLGACELTVAEFAAFAQASGYVTEAERGPGAYTLSAGIFSPDPGASWKLPGFAQSGNEPVLCLSWNDAIAYCNALSAKEGLQPAYEDSTGRWLRVPGSEGYRLPTEAEWEYAARGGKSRTSGPYPGKGAVSLSGWTLDNSGGRTHPVGTKSPNGLGLYDLCGNAWEWCEDYFEQSYYLTSPRENPSGPERGETKCARGGSWASRNRNSRVTQRYARAPDRAYSYMGFRLARSAGGKE